MAIYKKEEQEINTRQWALILGGSRGLGLASAKKLAGHGYHMFIVHRDRRVDLPHILNEFDAIRALGVQCHSFNFDALNQEKRLEVLGEMKKVLDDSDKISVLVHSIAKGHVKTMIGKESLLNREDLLLTLDAMAVSLYDWVKVLIKADFFASDSRVMAFTSEGNSRVIPSYGAVSAAKAALEALCRNMAVEMAPMGIKVNCIQAGVTDTASLAMIPHSEKIKAIAKKRNPFGRLTTPEDVANVVYLLSRQEADWITGTVIKADGGESLR